MASPPPRRVGTTPSLIAATAAVAAIVAGWAVGSGPTVAVAIVVLIAAGWDDLVALATERNQP